MVQLLKECGHEVVMVMKAGLLHSQGGEGERDRDREEETDLAHSGKGEGK